MKRNVVYKVIDQWIIAAYGRHSPTDEEHRECIALMERIGPERLRVLNITAGGSPTTAQRRELQPLLDKAKGSRSAVITDSALVRGAVTAIGWFNPGIKAYPPQQLREALKYLEVPEAKMSLFERHIELLKQQVD